MTDLTPAQRKALQVIERVGKLTAPISHPERGSVAKHGLRIATLDALVRKGLIDREGRGHGLDGYQLYSRKADR